jgi:predicted nuclease with RNAse H fold
VFRGPLRHVALDLVPAWYRNPLGEARAAIPAPGLDTALAYVASSMLSVVSRWLGIDVGGQRKGFDVALVDERRLLALEGRLRRHAVVELVERARPTLVAIDSPRGCAPEGQTARAGERQLAKSICGIRWTPDARHVHANDYYAWVVEGLALFGALAGRVEVIEVFPTASWTRWQGKRGSQTRSAWSRQGLAELELDGVPRRTNQDQRDAIAAAVTARLHTHGMTETLGEIVVPAVAETNATRTTLR